jgi:hypothetical protein
MIRLAAHPPHHTAEREGRSWGRLQPSPSATRRARISVPISTGRRPRFRQPPGGDVRQEARQAVTLIDADRAMPQPEAFRVEAVSA